MVKFNLRWVVGEKAADNNGEWQLQPKTPEAYRYALIKLNGGDWVDGIQAQLGKREIFLFRGKAMLSVVQKSLAVAGIPASEVSVKMPVPPELGPLFDEANDTTKAGR